jgi:hypothetical protein
MACFGTDIIQVKISMMIEVIRLLLSLFLHGYPNYTKMKLLIKIRYEQTSDMGLLTENAKIKKQTFVVKFKDSLIFVVLPAMIWL